MSDLREAAQQALEALGLWATGRDMDAVALNDLIFRLEAALAEPDEFIEDETIYCPTCGEEDGGTTCGMPDCGLRCGAEPVQEPKPLTDLSIAQMMNAASLQNGNNDSPWWLLFARAIEQAHGIGGDA